MKESRDDRTPPVDHDPEMGDLFVPHDESHDARYTARWLATLLGAVILYFGGALVHERWQQRGKILSDAQHMTGGDATAGRALLRPYGCATCHTIPGVQGSDGTIGPPLAGLASRMYVGGVVTNTPANLIRWIVNPKAIDAKTAMPVVGVSEEQARDIAAYLYTLR
ncbi:MAG TPA: c-type cytochrome [Gemmatimonadaceae bacterium]|nr:c-type cytochrome [Gemmatimonadaceae bacterium]